MNKTLHIISAMLAAMALYGCSAHDDVLPAADEPLRITSSIVPFDGDDVSRVNVEGNAFLTDEFIRIKVICPFVSSTEYGENTWGGSFDGFWLMKWTGGGWGALTAADGCDINGDYRISGSSTLSGQVHAQQTPYVFTAQTWSVERKFCTTGGKLVLQYTPVFHADQSRDENYRASDLLWAQSYLQTGSDGVHFDFSHKMAALVVTVNGDISADAVLTLEGMPDIDRAEIVVGDYYAARSKDNDDFGYIQKNVCAVADNGKVLGVGVNDDASGKAYTMPMTGNPGSDTKPCVPNTGTYTARNVGSKTYRLIVPPCKLADNAVFWLCDGEKRWKSTLALTEFQEGTLYRITINI